MWLKNWKKIKNYFYCSISEEEILYTNTQKPILQGILVCDFFILTNEVVGN